MDIVVNGPDGFTFAIAKTFVTGVPENNNQVEVRANKFQTTTSLFENLVAFNSNQNIDYGLSLDGDEVFLNFVVFGDYTVTVNELGSNIEVSSVPVEEPEPEPADPTIEEALADGYFQIQIIDTLEDDRELIVELTKRSSPTLSFTSGEDIDVPINAGTLSFNMRVAPSTDAHFLHLLSGDEERFLVKLNMIDPEENTFLLWQGFLLPDQYEEPYVQVQQFVEFTATDRLAAIKGRQLPPWFYFNTLPVMFLIAEILKLTGLEQNIAVRPAVIPSGTLRGFEAFGIDMAHYRKDNDGGFAEANEILEDVLKSIGCTLYGVKGMWYIEGFNRKTETGNQWLHFDKDGKTIGIYEYEKPVRNFDFRAGSILIQAKPPYGAVVYDPELNLRGNLYPDDIVKQNNVEILNTPFPRYSYHTNWRKYWGRGGDFPEMNVFGNLFWFVSIGQNNSYTRTESSALLNTTESRIRPFLQAGVRYRLNIDARVIFNTGTMSESNFDDAFEDGKFDHLIAYRMICNNVEIASSRPGFEGLEVMQYEKNMQKGSLLGGNFRGGNPQASVLNYKLEYEFDPFQTGELRFIFLAPIANNLGQGMSSFFCYIDRLQVVPVEAAEVRENFTAVRPIASTVTKELNMPWTATSNRDVINGFFTGFPTFANYFYNIDSSQAEIINGQNTFNYTFSIQRMPLPVLFQDRMFRDDNRRMASFIVRANGSVEYTPELLIGVQANIVYLGLLTAFSPIEKIMKSLRLIEPLAAGDSLQFMFVWYAVQQFELHDAWQTHDGTITDKIGKVLAQLHHGIRKNITYQMNGDVLGLVFPDELFTFFFDEEDRIFCPTSVTLNLSEGTTTVVGHEIDFEPCNDITYV
jgi:hypothetical protein